MITYAVIYMTSVAYIFVDAHFLSLSRQNVPYMSQVCHVCLCVCFLLCYKNFCTFVKMVLKYSFFLFF